MLNVAFSYEPAALRDYYYIYNNDNAHTHSHTHKNICKLSDIDSTNTHTVKQTQPDTRHKDGKLDKRKNA